MTANEQLASVGRNIQEKATLIWNVANTLFGAFKPHEYGLVILPMVVVKRFHDCLLPTHQAVLDTCKKVEHLAVKEGFLRTAAGYQFYNRPIVYGGREAPDHRHHANTTRRRSTTSV